MIREAAAAPRPSPSPSLSSSNSNSNKSPSGSGAVTFLGDGLGEFITWETAADSVFTTFGTLCFNMDFTTRCVVFVA